MERIKKWVWVSIVDYLKSQGQDSSKEARVKLAAEQWIENYNFSAGKNTELLNKLAGSRDSWATNISPTLPGTWSQVIDQSAATYGTDPAVDNLIASQYINKEDKLKETYIDKVGMDTGLYADIQNIDTQIQQTYKIIWMPDRDIFSRRDISPQEKIALSRERRDTAVKRNTHLRTLQQAKQKEIADLAKYEADKEREKQASLKAAMDYQKLVLEERKFGLEEKKFWLTFWKAEADLELKQKQLLLSESKFWLEESKFIASEVKDSDLIIWSFWSLDVWGKYGNWNVTQTYGTWSVLADDNVELVTWKVWTPGIDLAGSLWDSISAFKWWKIVSVVSWQTNIPEDKWGETGWSYWNQIVIQDDQWQLHYYNHLESVWNYKEWQAIQKGQLIGTMWNTGTSTGVHLDYRVKSNRWWEDPRAFMSKTGKWAENVNFTSVADFNKSTVTHKVSKISNETANNLVIQDMWDNKIGSKNISQMLKNDSISQELVDDYTNITYWMQFYTNRTDDQIVAALKEIDFENRSKSARDDELLQIAMAGKLNDWDDDLFEWGYFDIDENGYEEIDEYFDDVHKSIKEANERAEELRKKYNIK